MLEPMWTPLHRAPIWVRASIAGLLYGGFMVLWTQLWSDRPSLPASAAIWGFGGALFGLYIGWTLDRRERGLRLSGDQRAAAYRALQDGRLPDDPEVRDAAVHLARTRLQGASRPAVLAVLIVALASLAGWRAVGGQPLWWLAVAVLILGGAAMLYSQLRDRKRAEQLLASAG